jgi:hypothetical protein
LRGTILVLALFFVILNLWSISRRPRSIHASRGNVSELPIGALSDSALQRRRSQGARLWTTVGRRILGDKVSIACALILIAIFSALIAPWRAWPIPIRSSIRASSIGTAGYPLGTDELGRDMLARLIYGGRLRADRHPARHSRIWRQDLARPGRRLCRR